VVERRGDKVNEVSDDAAVSFIDGIVIEEDYLKLVSCLDSVDPWEEEFARICYYDGQDADPWSAYDLDWHVTSACLWVGTETRPRSYVLLSVEGQVEIQDAGVDGCRSEVIGDAGLHGDWSANFGYVFAIRQIGETLYVCGSNRQVYRRSADGIWAHADQGILLPETDTSMRCLMDIAGRSEDSIYAVGYQGEIFYFDGNVWAKIDVRLDEDLFEIKIVSENEVYIVGANGTLLKGCYRSGFKNLSAIEDNQRFSSVEFFNGTLFLASNLGMFVYDSVQNKIVPYKTNLTRDLVDCHVLRARDGVMWSIGYKDLACFDGKTWKRLDHPDNPPVGP
jgi:hypothetical protein